MLTTDEVMARCRLAYERTPLTLAELGQRMGYERNAAASAWKFLNRTRFPRADVVIRFAHAVRIPVARLYAPRRRRRMAHTSANRR